jgi:type II secretory pathway pseudopilin PulG
MKNQPPLAKWILVILVLLIAARWGAMWYFGRAQLTDEQQLVRSVARAQEAAQKRDPGGLTKLLSDGYMDKAGNNKQQMTAMIVGWMRGAPPYTVVPEVTKTDITGDTALMQLKVRYWATQPASGPGDEFRMAVAWRKEGRQWKVTSAEGWEAEQGKVMGGE